MANKLSYEVIQAISQTDLRNAVTRVLNAGGQCVGGVFVEYKPGKPDSPPTRNLLQAVLKPVEVPVPVPPPVPQ